MKMVSEYMLSSAILMKEEKKKEKKKGEEEGIFFDFFTEMDVSECWLHECCDPKFCLFDPQIFLKGSL